MANYDGFEKASYYGNKGERVALELLERNGFTTLDVSSNPNFFTAGDIIATKNNHNYFIEVKTDTTAHKSNSPQIKKQAGMAGFIPQPQINFSFI